ncbi:reverse transcriptase family protein [Pseudomonadota bacterium]
MLGGIADPVNPRGCKQHAAIHSNKKILITEDIANFFPNTTTDVIAKIWQHFFRCAPEISALLTTLTTYKGILPQGWKTSGYLANLVFWDREPQLVTHLDGLGFSYSRFMDDISISTNKNIDNSEKTAAIGKVYGMLYSKKHYQKRSKHEITPSHKPMMVTGLVVNSNKPTLPKIERKNTRAMVHKLEQTSPVERAHPAYQKEWNSVSGKVSRLTSFHAAEGKRLRDRLSAVKPPRYKLPSHKVESICRFVTKVEAMSADCVDSDAYKKIWLQATVEVGQLKSNNKDIWAKLRVKLSAIKPLMN